MTGDTLLFGPIASSGDNARVDAAAFYDVSDHTELQLNVENLLNERYFVFAHNNTNITLGGPTSVRGSNNLRF